MLAVDKVDRCVGKTPADIRTEPDALLRVYLAGIRLKHPAFVTGDFFAAMIHLARRLALAAGEQRLAFHIALAAGAAVYVPLADVPGVIAGGAHDRRPARHLRIEPIAVIGQDAVAEAAAAGQNLCPARYAKRIRAECPRENRAAPGQRVQVRRVDDWVAQRMYGIRPQVVGHEQEHIGAFGSVLCYRRSGIT